MAATPTVRCNETTGNNNRELATTSLSANSHVTPKLRRNRRPVYVTLSGPIMKRQAVRAGGSDVRLSWRPNCLTRAMTEREPDTARYLRVFAACDQERKGFLSREDLKVAMVILFGYKPCKMEVDSMLSSAGEAGGVHAEEFVKLMSVKRGSSLNFGVTREIFNVFDAQCRGFLNVDDFKRAFKHVAPHLPDHVVLQAFREVDRDSDGLVCYKDFEFAVSGGVEED